MKYIGIDLSKKSFAAAFAHPSTAGYTVREYANTPSGIKSFIGAVQPGQHCVMEATGNYGYLLLYLLDAHRIPASMVNPKQLKHFSRMLMSTTKTDRQDAVLIALYGEKMEPALYKMPTEAILLLKQQRTVIRQLKKQLVAMKNLRQSLEVLPRPDRKSVYTLDKTITFLTQQVRTLEKELSDQAAQHFAGQLQALTSIKGIGITLASALILATGGFTCFDNAKQLSRFIGICPTIQQSGSSLNVRGRINRNGDAQLRSMLYLASWSAIRYNADCKETYTRLKANGKPSKVALIAVANKLVRQAFAIAKKQDRYIDNYQNKKKETNVRTTDN